MSQNLIINEPPLIVLRSLALKIGELLSAKDKKQHSGLNEAIFLQQVHYCTSKFGITKQGRKWVYNTISKWHKQFPFWSERTLARIIKNLESLHLIVIDNFNLYGFDRTKWYSINYEILESLSQSISKSDVSSNFKDDDNLSPSNLPDCQHESEQNDNMGNDNLSQSNTPQCQHPSCQHGNTNTLDSHKDYLKNFAENKHESGKSKKIKFAEFVYMTENEYTKLTDQLGNSIAVDRCIEILNDYKGASGKKYKSDYHAIRNWVIKRYNDECSQSKIKSFKRTGNAQIDAANHALELLNQKELIQDDK